MVPPYVDLGLDVDFDFGQRPGAGRYKFVSCFNSLASKFGVGLFLNWCLFEWKLDLSEV